MLFHTVGIKAHMYPAQMASAWGASASSCFSEDLPSTGAGAAGGQGHGPILPSHIILICQEFQLLLRASLQMKFLNNLFECADGNGITSFPSSSTDLLVLLAENNRATAATNSGSATQTSTQDEGEPEEGPKLLSSRMQVSFSNVALEISTDYFGKKSTDDVAERDYGHYNPPSKPLVRPFAITYFTSLDRNQSCEIVAPPPAIMQSPYARPYYWSNDHTSIETTFVGVKDLIVECSMLDFVRIIHTTDVITARYDIL